MSQEVPTILYFRLRGRAEMVKVAFAIAGQQFEVEEIDDSNYSKLKTDFDTFPFGQVPVMKVGKTSIPQSMAMLRYVGRQHGLYGADNLEATMIDVLLDGFSDLTRKLVEALHRPEEERETAKADFFAAHIDPASKASSNSGCHFAYIAAQIKKYGSGYAVGDKPSIADAALFAGLDIYTLLYSEAFTSLYADVIDITKKVSELPSVKAYLESHLRLPNLWRVTT